MDRKAIPKSVRFEVMKRDKFTCQYCGSMAPDVVLEIDHVVPIAKGGTNEIMNLVVSCYDCNHGKSDKELSDDTTIKKQQAQLLEAAEKKEQIELMLEWKKSLLDLKDAEVQAVNDFLHELTSHNLTDHGKKTMAGYVKKYGLSVTLDGIKAAFDTYWDGSDNGTTRFFDKLPGVLWNVKNRNDNPFHDDAAHVANIIKKNVNGYGVWSKAYKAATESLESGIAKQVIIDWIYGYKDEWDRGIDDLCGYLEYASHLHAGKIIPAEGQYE